MDVEQKNTITTAVRMEIVRPLSETWDELGPRLRGLRSISHRMLNAGMLGLVADFKIAETKGEKAKLYSYPHIRAELASHGAWANGKAATAKAEDKRRLNDIAALVADVPGDIKAYANYIVDAKFRAWLKRRCDERLPMFKTGAPIFLPPVGCRIREVTSTVRLSLKLRSKGRVEVAAVPVSGSNWQTIRLVAEGSAKAGDCKLVYDEHKRKWYAFVTVTRPRPEPAAMSEGIVVAVNRGRYNMLYAVSSAGHLASFKGDDVLRFKQGIRARRAQLGRHRQELGSGARGHGKARREARYVAVERAERNFVRTKCQQAAAWLERFAAKAGAGVIVIEDFGTIEAEDLRFIPSWPWYQLKQSISWACTKSGRRLESTPSEHISSECPRCSNLDSSQAKSTGTFHCARCGFDRESDFVACINMLRRFGAGGVWDARFKRERELADALRDAAE
jgi:transposase